MVKMDKLDMKILNMLLDNCRESDRQIGKIIGISGGAVKSRIQKMIDNKVIQKFTLKIEPPILGYNLFYVVVTGENKDDILKQVKLIGDPFLVVPCVGGITVCGIVVKENVEQKIELTKNLMRDVRVLSIFNAENPGISSDLTRTDLEIIEKLLQNPRAKIDEIARTTNFSTKTITRSIEKLQNDDAILFSLLYDPEKLSGYVPYAILVWVENDFKKTLKTLEKKFSNSFLQKPFIAKNQIVLFMYSDNIFKLDELTQNVRDVDGVKFADLFIPKEINLPTKWISDSIKLSKSSKKLHLVYQTH
ncbi:MAG: AsnC family transcriptional regulator [Nitrosopumilales archaeon]|jgi:DNA-binding Lrp family transcriptional regulator|nr:MAG: AsnC family transcriptional regulator [Nitrosopumilales archaeon]